MSDLCKVTVNPFALQKAFIRQARKTIKELRAQAPGAKMVGEFAVKMAQGELKKKMNRKEQNSSEIEHQDEQPT